MFVSSTEGRNRNSDRKRSCYLANFEVWQRNNVGGDAIVDVKVIRTHYVLVCDVPKSALSLNSQLDKF